MAHDFKKFPELTNSQMALYYWDSPHKQILSDFEARVTKVTDGDTIRVKWEERDFDFPVRLSLIDAPEIGSGGRRSKDWLTQQILNEEVTVKINPKMRIGKFGRILGEIIHEGNNINQASLDEGFSYIFEDDSTSIL